jgi:hypothetical protein
MRAQQPELPDFAELPRETLEGMLHAGEEIRECYRVLNKGELNVVGELLKGQGKFYEFNHYPEGDVYDKDASSQYYYHAHRGILGEHGHFHTFLRAGGIPDDVLPVPYDGEESWPVGADAVSHLVAISMDKYGFPIGLFATNRWVTAEAWYRAQDVVRMCDCFEVDHAYPSWPVNRWITAMFRLFSPQIAALVCQRDAVVARWSEEHPGVDVFEDRELEITGEFSISVEKQIAKVCDVL